MSSSNTDNGQAPSQQASRPQRRRRHRRCRPRSKLPCPVPGCDGDACERHMMIHTLQCKVSGCPLGNPFFANVKELGKHLVDDHNNGDHKYCHWAGCDPNVERAPNNNMVHIRLHNYRI
ncbi:hypothetical protein PFICI_00377 [Pestalotiopsis fici W106-1]|uniref:Uncharacterized protein n=1 Tax=Pestalotiopsis fici (strain W106-1 / CGMCC3.15140) TaxID=1229662 RepID=W3XKK7_PESFW|nr:uncharacterized protein PFICI_00377 [Pestalotiopsis fici W106-1]ETS86549.1 hypothetical protein PFICI_00377 [Pestalotiopsis fici W106-1]